MTRHDMTAIELTRSRARPSAWLWVALIGLASLGLSRAFACAMPFAALATVAAFALGKREAMVLVVSVWLANQAIGFGVMHYPWDASTLGWGVAIGLAAVAALAAAAVVARLVGRATLATMALGLLASYAAYELVLWAATAVLASGPGAFSIPVVARLLAINAVAFGLLLAVDALARVASRHAPGRQAAPQD